MSQIFGSDITLPRDPVTPMQATTKQYVDSGLETKAEVAHIHNGTISVDMLGALFSQLFETVAPLYTEEMTPFYTWRTDEIGVPGSTVTTNWCAFEAAQNVVFAPGKCVFMLTPTQLRVSRKGYHEGFMATSYIASSSLESISSFYSIPRTMRLLQDGTLMFLSHRLTNGYFLENIKIDTTISLVKRTSLTTHQYFYDVVQSEDDPTRTIFLGCDSSGAAIYRSTNLGSASKSTITT